MSGAGDGAVTKRAALGGRCGVSAQVEPTRWTSVREDGIRRRLYIDLVRGDPRVSYAGVKYAVRRAEGVTLSKRDGEFHFEKQPSERDADHYAEFRFDTFDEALAALLKAEPVFLSTYPPTVPS